MPGIDPRDPTLQKDLDSTCLHCGEPSEDSFCDRACKKAFDND